MIESKRNKISKHPRPDFYRDHWLDLNGEWNFVFDDGDAGIQEKWYAEHQFPLKIQVPFVYQSKASGIFDHALHEVVWYKKCIPMDEKYMGRELILNFGAVDYEAKVWVNGNYVGEHTGGYDSFCFNITRYIQGAADISIVIRVKDGSFVRDQPRGKQTWTTDVFGCWYTRHTGIWQDVWIDVLNRVYIKNFRITPDFDHKKIGIRVRVNEGIPENVKLHVKILFKDALISSLTLDVCKQEFAFDVNIANDRFIWDKIAHWHPADPNLYDIVFELVQDDQVQDSVISYFGMRKISVSSGHILLNNHDLYQKLILNQGYYKEGMITPDNDDVIISDIRMIKELGFNGMRIHQKVESPKFLYWCDRIGLLVWEEMPSAYEFNERAVQNLAQQWQNIVKRDANHPCIIAYVPFNESWGVNEVRFDKRQQEYTKAIYYLTKSIDGERLVISNDGWEHTITDVCTVHNYTASSRELYEHYSQIEKDSDPLISPHNKHVFAEGHSYQGQPFILSEYGGISFTNDEGWGYNDKVKDEETFFARYEGLTSAIKKLQYMRGYCYTQYTDVEHEQNGLLTIDRKPKVDLKRVKEINDK